MAVFCYYVATGESIDSVTRPKPSTAVLKFSVPLLELLIVSQEMRED